MIPLVIRYYESGIRNGKARPVFHIFSRTLSNKFVPYFPLDKDENIYFILSVYWFYRVFGDL